MLDRVIISGGGTGGHIYPAIAIADELKLRNPNIEILFVGASDRMEMEKVPQAGYEIKGLWISGFQRSLSLKNLAFPFKLFWSVIKAYFIVKKFKPQVAIGTGGYASGPTLFVANKTGVPTLIQEQNSFPGITNRLLSKTVDSIAVAYSGMERFFPKNITRITGNPVRRDLIDIPDPKQMDYEFFGLNPQKPVLLVLGGSLGSKRINALIGEHLEWILGMGVQVIWQTGKIYFEQYSARVQKGVAIHAYISDMAKVYSLSNFIISRAGASSVSELALAAKPVMFIPSPNVAEDHQRKNAEAVVEKSAAIMIVENDLDSFESVFEKWINDSDDSLKMAENFKKMALPNATSTIVNEIENLI